MDAFSALGRLDAGRCWFTRDDVIGLIHDHAVFGAFGQASQRTDNSDRLDGRVQRVGPGELCCAGCARDGEVGDGQSVGRCCGCLEADIVERPAAKGQSAITLDLPRNGDDAIVPRGPEWNDVLGPLGVEMVVRAVILRARPVAPDEVAVCKDGGAIEHAVLDSEPALIGEEDVLVVPETKLGAGQTVVLLVLVLAVEALCSKVVAPDLEATGRKLRVATLAERLAPLPVIGTIRVRP